MFVDAPVSGGVNAAAAGTLTFMVGAETGDQFQAALRVLENMGAKVYRGYRIWEQRYTGDTEYGSKGIQGIQNMGAKVYLGYRI